jgi:hypothetical protein
VVVDIGRTLAVVGPYVVDVEPMKAWVVEEPCVVVEEG